MACILKLFDGIVLSVSCQASRETLYHWIFSHGLFGRSLEIIIKEVGDGPGGIPSAAGNPRDRCALNSPQCLIQRTQSFLEGQYEHIGPLALPEQCVLRNKTYINPLTWEITKTPTTPADTLDVLERGQRLLVQDLFTLAYKRSGWRTKLCSESEP